MSLICEYDEEHAVFLLLAVSGLTDSQRLTQRLMCALADHIHFGASSPLDPSGIHMRVLCRCDPMNMHCKSMPATWNAVRKGEIVPDMDAAKCVVSAIAQVDITQTGSLRIAQQCYK